MKLFYVTVWIDFTVQPKPVYCTEVMDLSADTADGFIKNVDERLNKIASHIGSDSAAKGGFILDGEQIKPASQESGINSFDLNHLKLNSSKQAKRIYQPWNNRSWFEQRQIIASFHTRITRSEQDYHSWFQLAKINELVEGKDKLFLCSVFVKNVKTSCFEGLFTS